MEKNRIPRLFDECVPGCSENAGGYQPVCNGNLAMTRIFIIRHAEAEGNLFRRIHGHYDSTVTYKGLRQIKALEDRFAGEQIDACYSSDLVRTRTTAASVWKPKHLPLRCDPRLREVHLGEWEDVPFGQLGQEQPEMLWDNTEGHTRN